MSVTREEDSLAKFSWGYDRSSKLTTKMSEQIPKRMEKLRRAARADSNGDICFPPRTSSTTSIDSGKSLRRSSSSLEDSLRHQRENMGLPSLDSPAEAPSQAARPTPIDATERRRKFGISRMRLPQANVTAELACPIQEGCAAVSGALQEGVVLQDLNPANLFTNEDDDNDDIDRDTSLVPTKPLPEPTLVPVQPSDACSESGKAKQTQVEVDRRDFLPLIPQNANKEVPAHLEKNREDTKQEMIASNLPAIYCVRTVPVITVHLKHIESTLVVITIQRIHAYLENQQSMFESETFDIFFLTEQLKYRGKIVVLITSSKILSLGFSLVKGENDKHLPWPFNMMVSFKLINTDDRQSRIRGFRSDINGSNFPECLSRPSSCNTAIGFPNFVPVTSLSNGFIENNSLRVIARITSKKYVPYSDVKLELPGIVKA